MATIQAIQNIQVKPCPFCAHIFDSENFADSIHPENRDKTLFSVNCLESEGGCGAKVLGASKEEAVSKWNTRKTTYNGN